jgi:hypothetical protein
MLGDEDEIEGGEVEGDLVRVIGVLEGWEVGIPEVGSEDCEEPGGGSGFCEPRDMRTGNCCCVGKGLFGGNGDEVGLS